MASRRQLSTETVTLASTLVNEAISAKMKTAKVEDIAPYFTARQELTALGTKLGAPAPKRTRTPKAETPAPQPE